MTARPEPEFKWFVDSVRRESDCPIMVISDGFVSARPHDYVSFHRPKPTVWSGPHRLTKENWWSKASALNTAICLCRTDWIMCADDRSVLLPGWFDRVKAAMDGDYAVCGTYEKRHKMRVENGRIIDPGAVTGEDSRVKYTKLHRSGTIMDCPGEWWYGCLNAMPLESALTVNGYDESCDGIGMEDIIFGMHLKNAGYPIKYDLQFAMVEDRTPEKLGPVIRREDKGVSPADKSHALLEKLRKLKRASHPFNLRDMRQVVMQNGHFPKPHWPTHDWYDGEAIKDFR